MENTLGPWKGPFSSPLFSLAQTGLNFLIPSHGYTAWCNTPQKPQNLHNHCHKNLNETNSIQTGTCYHSGDRHDHQNTGHSPVWWKCAHNSADLPSHLTNDTFVLVRQLYDMCHDMTQTGFRLDRIRHPPWTWRLQMLDYLSTRLHTHTHTRHHIPGEHNLKLVLLPGSNRGLKDRMVVWSSRPSWWCAKLLVKLCYRHK